MDVTSGIIFNCSSILFVETINHSSALSNSSLEYCSKSETLSNANCTATEYVGSIKFCSSSREFC